MRFSDRLTPQWRHRLFVAYLIAMTLVFLTPTPDAGIDSIYVDKVIHCVLFIGFALVYSFDRGGSSGRVFMLSAFLAAAVEVIQGILPFREAEFADFVAGVAGAALGTVVLLLWRAYKV